MDKITLKNLRFYAYHGVLPEEQAKGQNFYIDVEMYVDLASAGATDNLDETVDYSAVYEVVKDITEKNKFRLIEKLAGEISREILSRYRKINEIIVRVRKPEAPINGEFDWAEVEIKRSANGA
ncbi:MAG: dihydroneopterin aldolase [Clostridia bacterium]|nr:dihydroneopterin aldolase [Clostridia bacterium]